MNADKWTDLELEKLEKRIAKEYAEAEKELKQKAEVYFKEYRDRWEIEHKAFEEGKYTEEQFKAWELAQLGRGARWNDLKDQMAERLAQSSLIAQDYINGKLPAIYVKNSNEIAKIAQDSAMDQGITGIRFDLVDEHTVKRLMEGSREVRPYKPIQIDLPKVNNWNYTKLQNALLQGILQGDSIDRIADRFQAVSNMNRSSAIRNARTAVTGAQNGGKMDRYKDLSSKGCDVYKMWIATADDRTREEHMEAWDEYGTEELAIPYDEPFDVGGEELMYPADPSGSGWNIYNCRCTMRTKMRFKSILSDETRERANIRLADEDAPNEANIQFINGLKTASNYEDARDILKSELNFEKIGNIEDLNQELVVEATNQLALLEEKFGMLKQSSDLQIIAQDYKDMESFVMHDPRNPQIQLLSLCPKSFAQTTEEHYDTVKKYIEKKWYMPADDDKIIAYNITHEYGHIIENVIMQKMYDNGFMSIRADATKEELEAREFALQSIIKQEIINVAKSRNPQIDLNASISKYGKSKPSEFFAEAFVNSQLGQPNEIGEAMEIWLKKERILK